MLTLAPCLTPDGLRRLAGGLLSEAEEDEASLHLGDCRACAAAYDEVFDPLVAALRGGRNWPPPLSPGLVDRLKHLIAADSTVDPTRQVSDETPGHARTLDAPERFDMLTPARGGGELGWLGRFRVTAVLGQGGMGYVFRAEDTNLRRAVALKVIRPAGGGPATEGQRERFLREARAAARLDHPSIVPVHEVGEAGGTPYLVMPLLRGRTLADRLRAEGPVPYPLMCRLARQVADGLAAAHAAGLAHRDIKPSNLWVEPGPDGESAKVLDFGLAKGAEGPAGTDLTGSGVLVGTPAYMAPEQANLDPVDHRADLYSLRVVLYEMATGRRLFAGKTNGEILSAVRRFDVPRPAALLPGAVGPFAEVVAALLEQSPAARRPQSARELADRLRALEREAESVAARAAAPPRRRDRWAARVAAGFFGAAAVCLAGVVVTVTRTDDKGNKTVTEIVADTPGDLPNISIRGGDLEIAPPAVTPPPASLPKAEKPPADKPRSPPIPPDPTRKLPTLDGLRRNLIPTANLVFAGGGDAAKVPPQVVALLGGVVGGKLSAADGHTDAVHGLALSPDGVTLASAGADGTVRMWDLTGPSAKPVGLPRTLPSMVTGGVVQPRRPLPGDGLRRRSGRRLGLADRRGRAGVRLGSRVQSR